MISTVNLLQKIYFNGTPYHATAWLNGDSLGYSPVEKPATPADIQAHLKGSLALGSYTLHPDSMVTWACWDVDVKPFDQARAKAITSEIVKALGTIPHVVEFSGSKGYHIWLYFADPVPAAKVKPLCEAVRDAVGAPTSGPIHVECYPKQSELTKALPKGNLVKVPLGVHPKTGKRSEFVDPQTWQPLTEKQTITALQTRASFADFAAHVSTLEGASDVQKIVRLVGIHWKEGQRHDLAIALAGLLANAGKEQAYTENIIEQLCAQYSGDPANVLKAVKDTYRKKAAGTKVAGFTGLQKMMVAADLDKLSKLVGGQAPTLDLGDGYHLTELGNAQRFLRQHGENVRYVVKWGKWLIWQGTHWAIDESLEIERLAETTIRGIYQEAAESKDDTERKAIAKWALQSESRDKLIAMLGHARKHVVVSHEQLDRELYHLPCLNGTIDLRTGELIPAEREHYATNCLDIEYDRATECPTWEQAVNEWMNGDESMVDFLQRALGYSLTGDVSAQCLFLLLGNGNNGKSTMMETVKSIMGKLAQKAPPNMLMVKNGGDGVPNDIARLAGARLVVASEVESGRRLAESLVKDLTGKDTITARFMRQEFFDFTPTHKLWIYGNHKPVVKDDDNGIWRRIKLIPFDAQLTNKDEHFAEKLATERTGILTWMVNGCLAWQAMGLNPPEKVTQATQGYRDEMDVLGSFVDDCCELVAINNAPPADLYEAYGRWCSRNSETPVKKSDFSRKLEERGFRKARGNFNKVGHVGLRLLMEMQTRQYELN